MSYNEDDPAGLVRLGGADDTMSQTQGTQTLAFGDLLWPVFLSLMVLFLLVFLKLLLDAEKTMRTSRYRGGPLFRAFFIAPDLCVLALSLLISTRVLESALEAQGTSTYYGTRFGEFFFALILTFVSVLVLISIVWLRTEDNHKAFPVREAAEVRYTATGTEERVTVYPLRLFAGLFSKVGFPNLVLCNILGIFCVVCYVLFIFFGFVTPWPY